MKVGVICGLEAEARALGKLRRDSRVLVGISAAKPDRASALARDMVSEGVEVLISWGICGALDPDLASGTLILPSGVIDQNGARVDLVGLAAAGAPTGMILAGSDIVVPTPEAKARLHSASGACAVDMETHRVARVADDLGIPCMAIRAISDPADRALPAEAEHALDDLGRPRILPVLAGLVRHPWRIGALLAAKRDLDTALEALSLMGTDLLQGVIESPG